ncbi:MAG: LamG-like jellyroll fold domain-containing protein [Prosthecobacter sp.]
MPVSRIFAFLLAASTSVCAQMGGVVPGIDSGLLAKWDAVMPLDATTPLNIAGTANGMPLGDFSICFAMKIQAFAGGDHSKELLWLASDGTGQVHFDVGPAHALFCRRLWKQSEAIAMPEMNVTGQWQHVALVVKRDPKQALSGLWLNGVERNSWNEPPGNLVLTQGEFLLPGVLPGGQIAGLRLYNRALSRPEIIELAMLPPMAGLKPKLSPFGDSMKVMMGEVIAVLGGTEAVAVVEDGAMEALLMTRFPGSRVKLRDLAWEADTVFRQDRPMNFGGLKQQLERCGATAVVMMFGRQECLEQGDAGLTAFRVALEKTVAEVAAVTPRMVLVEPPPFEGVLIARNEDLKKYAAVIEEVAKAHSALFAPWRRGLQSRLTRDGLNLVNAGASRAGQSIATLAGGDLPVVDENLRALIRQKNTLWHRHWRPANWAFLHGDRTAQPSSRDHEEPTRRWFPGELEKYLPLIQAKENDIWKRANELGGKLP